MVDVGPVSQEASLAIRFFRSSSMLAVLCVLAGSVSVAQNTSPVTLDTSETIFSVLTAVNSCGYDLDLGVSDPVRSQVRAEVTEASRSSLDALQASQNFCQFYKEHQDADPSRTLSRYVSLALFLGPPPGFTVTAQDSQIAPDAQAILGAIPLLQKFYEAEGLHAIWLKHQIEYAQLPGRYHTTLSKMLFDTEIYLKLPSFGYLGRQFTVYLQPMGAPGQTNARNYGANYYVVISPDKNFEIRTDQIRHTYLHYLLDPLALKYPDQIRRLTPLMAAVRTAPMDQSFKDDPSLLVTECLIRAIEIRLSGSTKVPESEHDKAIDDADEQGFVLTRYFYDALLRFEKDPAGLRNAYGDMLAGIDVGKEVKRLSQVQFASTATPDPLSHSPTRNLLNTAEQRLSAGDPASAQKLAQEALDEKIEDPGRALFILAQAATMNRDIEGARNYFQQALQATQEPKVVAWSHVFLGRIFDLQDDREAALGQYRAALGLGDTVPGAKAAAERGLQQPYAPPSTAQ
jgi:tetratricopeptide (TPR) repeat protein